MLKVFLFWPKRDKMGMILKGAFPPRKGFFTMKFSEMTYTRPDIDALLARCKELTAKAAAADSGEALVEVYYEQSRAFADYNTAANLANIHYTCDTRDDYWKAEQDFFDANGPAVSNASVEISRAFLANPHVDALTEAFGSTCVAGMKNAVLGMDERTVALQQEYNALVSTYQQIYGGALVELDGKQLTIPQLGPYKESTDAAVRRAAYEAEAGYFDAHRAELDELYRQDLQDALNYLKETDPEFYRVEKDYSSATYTMDSLAQGYRGISTYNSVLNGNLKEFVDVCYPELYYMDQNRYAFWPNAEDNFLAAFTGVRYLLSKSGDLDSSKYELMQQFGGIYLYRNVQEAATARFYVNTISEDSLKELCNEENRETLLENSLALEDGREIEDLSDLEEISDAQKKSSVVLNAPEKDSCITGTVSARADGYVLCMIPYENGWTVSVDGEEVETEKGDLGFLAFPVKEGEHQLTITFHAPGLKAGAGASIVC